MSLTRVLMEQEVKFRVDYSVPSINRDFGTVFLGDKNVALLVVSGGWAKVELNVVFLNVDFSSLNYVCIALLNGIVVVFFR